MRVCWGSRGEGVARWRSKSKHPRLRRVMFPNMQLLLLRTGNRHTARCIPLHAPSLPVYLWSRQLSSQPSRTRRAWGVSVSESRRDFERSE